MRNLKSFEKLIRNQFNRLITTNPTYKLPDGSIIQVLEQQFKSIIKQTATAKMQDIEAFWNYKNQLVFDSILNKKPLDIYFDFISYVIYTNRSEPIISTDKLDKWEQAVEIFYKISKLRDFTFYRINHIREKILSEQIQYLARYKIKTKDGAPNTSEKNKLLKIVKDIEDIIEEIGGLIVINHIFSILRPKFNATFKRYLLPKEFSSAGGITKIDIPYNYILMLSFKYVHCYPKKPKNVEKNIQKIIKLSRALVSLYDVLSYTRYETINSMSIELFAQYMLFDHAYRFQQLGYDELILLLQNIFDATRFANIEKDLGFSINEYCTIISKIYSFKQQKLPCILFNEHEQNILDRISHHEAINNDYILLNEYSQAKNQFTQKPLIRREEDYLFIDPLYCSFGFYEIIANELRTYEKEVDEKLGYAFEDTLRKLALKQKYTIHYGCYNKKEECDLVIETDEAILFCELKKKGITRQSIDGDKFKIVVDIGTSLLKAHEQANKHDMYLHQNGKIVFETGSKTTLNLSNKKTEKVFISLYDFMSLGTQDFVSHLLQWIASMQVNIDDKSKLSTNEINKIDKINKLIDSLRNYINHADSDKPNGYREKWLDVWCIPYSLIFFLLTNNTPDSFYHSFKIGKHMSFSTGDIFAEYFNAIDLYHRAKK